MDPKSPSQKDIIEFQAKRNKDEYKIEKEGDKNNLSKEKKIHQNLNY